ncbi:class I SAM-dependent methyltransferase [Nocardiopsis halotolerans]|uniref:class I SAM-dependent methyltransferase n=1 Tax=Nocardiopsis halotolerans TaxID=124252 RepID=UPI0003482297|nr:class I SAM-dependent methyltransferase [Nocardiopsis halotolerans]
MSTTGASDFLPEWLALREEADARARSGETLTFLRAHLEHDGRDGRGRVVADLGCGTGSLGRWLAPRLPGPQRWILFDRDPGLLDLARRSVPAAGVETRRIDLGSLRAADLDGVDLVVASALLDVLTRSEVDTLVEAVAAVGCPALFTLSVAGRVELSPAHPLDRAFSDAFNAHQRREGRLGPDAHAATARSFERLGYPVRAGSSPWRLGPGDAELTRAWLRGWVGAAVEQDPSLPGEEYLRKRLEVCSRGGLGVVVHHTDLLARPLPSGDG